MHGSLTENEALLGALLKGLAAGPASASLCAVCVPFPYLSQVQALLRSSRVEWGAQDVSEHAKGAYTGEVSAAMLKDFGCRYAIVGHSERRTIYREDDAIVIRKFQAAQAVGLIPILCVGENLDQRERGETDAFVSGQVSAVIDAVGIAAFAQAVVAYEPIWAIGTGKTASPEQAQAVHAVIRSLIADHDAIIADSLRILYGGSVKGSNAAELLGQKDIDGGLVGGASLDATDFLAIYGAAAA
jgi:triosephosphate isomerase